MLHRIAVVAVLMLQAGSSLGNEHVCGVGSLIFPIEVEFRAQVAAALKEQGLPFVFLPDGRICHSGDDTQAVWSVIVPIIQPWNREVRGGRFGEGYLERLEAAGIEFVVVERADWIKLRVGDKDQTRATEVMNRYLEEVTGSNRP